MDNSNENLRERHRQYQQSSTSTVQRANVRHSTKKQKSTRCKTICGLGMFFLLPLVLIVAYPYLYLRFKPLNAHYISLPQRIEFDGALTPNRLLQSAIYFGHTKFRGAESIVFVNSTMYGGLLNGQIARFDSEGNVHAVTQVVDNFDRRNCDDYGLYFESKVECGRPLGLRVVSDFWIYFVDAYYGLFKFNTKTNERILVLAANDRKFADKPLMFANDLDLDDNGDIYFTDSSMSRAVHEAIELFVEATTDGRLFRYNEITGELALLIDNLYFANGVQLTPNKDAVIIAETSMSRLTKYYLKGAKQGHREVFINLPGFPDNIRTSEHGTLLVGFSLARHAAVPNVLDILGQYPILRTIAGSVFNLRAIMFHAPRKYALVCEYQFDGTLRKSWHDSDGRIIQSIAGVTMHKSKLYLSSFYSDFIGVIDY